ncbi:Fic family protein [Levilactobacillus tujiorum]|uniref:Fic family protein n=1 Tax=Levilactobacillus tujiorum TaxID=2912243 RepID=A0ABX1L6T5_9LACO|nr:Fic family protein [Levilactobacillus tujiorum]MCH5465753.1 Fic family protein [Levilactobacillus tujiorum]NLR12950.1 Fic family protein [Lactobacillus sp. HBUAS51387]NLR30780.1 Fic family protein [Levilactobacillus tujiorum]
MKQLPGIAQTSYSNRLLTSEIYFTNEIEGVKTDRVEIGTVVAERQQPLATHKLRRLESTVHQYATVLQGMSEHIQTLGDFRRIYDELLKGEIAKSELPDGKLFRNDEVYIGTASQRVHVPPMNEKAITEALIPLITFMNSHQTAYLTKAVVTHFMFENTHPFNDGNGRMGRYLLASYIAGKLDPFTGLSISGAIHQQRATYYRVFKEADDAENRADVTIFVKTMLEIIESGQDHVIQALQNLSDELTAVGERLQSVVSESTFPIAYIFAQSSLFAGNEELGIKDTELIEFLNKQDNRQFPRSVVKRLIKQLEDENVIVRVKSRPLQHVLSERFKKQN